MIRKLTNGEFPRLGEQGLVAFATARAAVPEASLVLSALMEARCMADRQARTASPAHVALRARSPPQGSAGEAELDEGAQIRLLGQRQRLVSFKNSL